MLRNFAVYAYSTLTDAVNLSRGELLPPLVLDSINNQIRELTIEILIDSLNIQNAFLQLKRDRKTLGRRSVKQPNMVFSFKKFLFPILLFWTYLSRRKI